MTNAELIDGLRCCAESTNIIERCDIEDCPYHLHSWSCIDDMLRDAADALEAADKRIDGLQKLVDINTERCEALRKQLRESHKSYEKHINELETQLPKEGEWIELADRNERKYSHICSKCHRFNIHEGEIEFYHYCPNCGARMNHKYCDVVNGCVMCDVELCNGKEKQE